MATLIEEKEVTCPPALAVQRIYRALGCEGMHETHHVLAVPFTDLGLPDVGELSREVVVTVGDPMRKGSLTRMQLSWRVPHSDVFPVFHGFFEIQPLSSYEIHLALLGYYHAPFGMLGAVFDMVLGHRIAEATVHHLIEEIAKAIEEPITSRKVARLG